MALITVESPNGKERHCIQEQDWHKGAKTVLVDLPPKHPKAPGKVKAKNCYAGWKKIADGNTLDARQWEAWKEVKEHRAAAALDGVLETDFGPVEIDAASRAAIGDMARVAARVDLPAIEWTMADNKVRTFTSAEFLRLDTQVVMHTQTVHTRARRLREAIEQAKTPAKLSALRHRQGWSARKAKGKGKP